MRVAALTPAIRSWEAAYTVALIPGLGTLHFNSDLRDRRDPDADHLRSSIAASPRRPQPRRWLAIIVLVPLLLVGLVPILTGSDRQRQRHRTCAAHRPTRASTGSWNIGGWTLFLGGLYIAAWSTYGFETAVCYTRELKQPQDRHVPGHLLLGPPVLRVLLPHPLLLPGHVLGHAGMLAPGIVDGTGSRRSARRQHDGRRQGRSPRSS